ncbi:hypothetical protein [Muriventricola aceti]|uniref:hypothetical protein n=1 Tax=Muriventricola aceti TaxID=2981773 RepID=UPI0021CF6AC3|nr:hypothetical protein [Muriventricola aceti]
MIRCTINLCQLLIGEETGFGDQTRADSEVPFGSCKIILIIVPMADADPFIIPDPCNELIAPAGASLSARQHSPAEIRKQMKLIVKTTSTEQEGVFHGLHIFKYSVGCSGDPVIQLVGLRILASSRKQENLIPRGNRKDRLAMEENLQPPVLSVTGFNLLFSEAPG